MPRCAVRLVDKVRLARQTTLQFPYISSSSPSITPFSSSSLMSCSTFASNLPSWSSFHFALEEEEKTMGCFSPQLGGRDINCIGGSKSCQDDSSPSVMPSTPCIINEENHSHLCGHTPAVIKDDNLSANLSNSLCTSASSVDLLCPACSRLLFRPAVLNCGHVLCKGCIVVPEDGIIICRVCEIPHPTDCPNICLELNNFLEERFPDEYAERKGNVEEMKSQFQHKNPSFCCDAETSSKKRFRICKSEEDLLPWWKEYGSKVHYGAGCDYCGMYPIVGDRYRCEDCVENMGFDLCGDCYKTSSKRPGRFNQQHTSDHKFELVKPLELSASLTFQLVGEHIVDSSGTPVVAISALEDPSDGWIAVDSADFQHNIGDNSPEENRATSTLEEILGESAPVEFSDDALETSGAYVDSAARHDSDMEDQAEDSPPTA
ncbi:hypothetical protein KSS87_002986 [Heliosperma pusillum]|nr:hypothetical protein KSS87_002986 [Heliosperma pusillum]